MQVMSKYDLQLEFLSLPKIIGYEQPTDQSNSKQQKHFF